MSLVFIDIETTGLNPNPVPGSDHTAPQHVPWEIAIITNSGEYCWILELKEDELGRAEPMALSVGQYYARAPRARDDFWVENSAKFQATTGNMVTTQDGRRAIMSTKKYITIPLRLELASFLAEEIGNSHLVGAVPGFDARFVGDFMRTHRYPPSWHYHLVDVEALAAGKLGLEPPWKSRELYKKLGVTDEYFPAHTALGDARLAKAVYERVMGLPPTYPGAIEEIEEESERSLLVDAPQA